MTPTVAARRTLGSIATAAAAVAMALLAPTPGAAGAAPPADPAPGDQQTVDEAAVGQPGRSWSVQPAGDDTGGGRAYLVHDVQPGTRFADAIWIDNFGAEPLTLDLYAADAYNTAGGGLDVRTASEPASDVGLWARPEASVVTIEPGTRVEVPVHVDVPSTATPGDHVGGIVASSVSRTVEESGRTVEIESRVGVRVYLRVDGEIVPELAVDDVRFDWTAGMNPSGGRLTMSYTVRNAGNVRLGAEQFLEVTGPFDWSMRRPDIEPIAELLPGAQVRQEIVVDDLLAAVRANAAYTLIPVDTSGDLPAAAAEVDIAESVWAIPWSLVVALLLGVIVLIEWRRRVARRQGTSDADAEEGDADAGEGGADASTDAAADRAVDDEAVSVPSVVGADGASGQDG